MSELLPSLQAEAMQSALVEYVTTAIEFSDQYARDAFSSFLSDREEGIFRGPFLRTRLPFQTDPTEPPLRVLPDWFQPYAHQAEAFRRLTTDPSVPGAQDRQGLRVPEPTIVTTGTGSGKTEAFLYPLLDYAVRARKQGLHGIKAIILYPMNALANDQAARLARMIHENPALQGVTAALYIGEHSGAPRTAMSAEGLIEDRHTIRSVAPDIILTNYKMLDQLLLRSADRPLWEQSAESLRYLVLDEFHTYNGAQGTDVAMLIRRLRLVLDRLAPQRTAMIPVATSATLGDESDIAPVAEFASTIFGVEFTRASVVTERRVTQEQLRDEAMARVDRSAWQAQEHPTLGQLEAILDVLPVRQGGLLPDPADLTRRVLGVLWRGPDAAAENAELDPATERDLFLAHPLVSDLLSRATRAIPVRDLSTALVPHLDPDTVGARFIEALCGALSHVRSRAGRNSFPNVEVHLWTREVSRVDRAVSPAVAFSWSDDRTVHDGSFLPAIYCRHCGRTGWGIALTGTNDLVIKPQAIREAHVRHTGRFRALISLPGAEPGDNERVRFLDPERRSIEDTLPAEDAGDVDSLPVLMHVGLEADALSNADTCPSCQVANGIRFVGSRTATLLSVALSSLFGTAGLDPSEKKSLVFTDSVQDAAHRAGFVEARSYSLALRSAIETALTEEPAPVEDVVERMMANAHTPEERYRLLHPTIAQNPPVRGFWDDEETARRRRRAADLVATRLEFDLELEAGLVESYGRTLAATGTAAASVQAPEGQLRSVGEDVLERAARQMTLDVAGETPAGALAGVWVRGVLERLRTDGAIAHEWLRPYRAKGGMRYEIWGGRRPKDVMPAFPPGRRSPTFPATGRFKPKSEFTDPGNSSSWYVDWTSRCLGLDKRSAGHLLKPLFTALSEAGFTDTVGVTERGTTTAESYGLRPEKLMMALATQPAEILRCPVCGEMVTGLPETLAALDGAPCTTYQCKGHLRRDRLRSSYYRSLYRGDMRRVIAREHTSLLQAETRLEYENEFKNSETTPGAPNVLVATPTLEMGIDIGDLSTVILASIPDTVASYLQRVGRAGRLTGNSLDLAFMTTRGKGSAFIEPEFMLNGAVRPPAAYLSAEEILHRQYTAFLMDRMAGDDGAPDPARAASVMKSSGPQTFLGVMLADAKQHSQQRLDEFLSAFQVGDNPRRGMTREAAVALREWATWPGGDEPSGLERAVKSSVQRWWREKDELTHRRKAVEKRLQDIAAGTVVITAEEDQKLTTELEGQQQLLDEQEQKLGSVEDEEARKREERRLSGSQARLRAEASQLSHEHWIGVLERFGVLPNFTLYDDAVSLEATLTYRDEHDNWKHIPAEYERSGFTALTELAPGNHFYAGGHELEIDSVDVGSDGDGVRRVAFCPDCGHTTTLESTQRLDACPACQRPGIADEGQHLHVVELTKVSSTMELNRAKITDASEDRASTSYDTLTIPDFTGADTRAQWSVGGTGVGITFRRDSRLTRLNVGKPREGAREATLAGRRQRIGGFTICAVCGHLDTTLGENKAQEHQGWCTQRRVENPESVSVVLSRELTTETIMMSLPPSITDDSSGRSLWSFYAALMLGLRERFGGEISHLGMEVVPDVSRNNADSLMLYDAVPGGTGYLAELASPDSLWHLLRQAQDYLTQCPCQDEGKSACFRCLMPHVRASHRESLDRRRAVEILGTVLGSDAPGEDMTWRIEEGSAPLGDDFESSLEHRFRRLFRAAVGQLPGADVTDTVGDGGKGFSAIIGEVRYSFASQVQLGDTQPDSLITWPATQGIKGAAIYLDGREYHASLATNRVGDDAAKRRGLREQGYLVYALTNNDLNAYEAAQRGETTESVLANLWDTRILEAVRSRGAVDGDDLAYLTANPMDQLLSLLRGTLRDPLKRQRTVSQQLNLLLFTGKPTPVSPDALGEQAVGILDTPPGDRLPGPPHQPTAPGFVRRDGPLVVLGGVTSPVNRLAVVLDDREAAVGSPYFNESWRQWLALANLRQDLQPGSVTVVETRSSLLRIAEEEPEAARDSWVEFLSHTSQEPAPPRESGVGPLDVLHVPQSVTLPQEWQSLVAEAVTPEEGDILRLAGRLELPLPDVGEEFHGYPVDLAWPEWKIAWLSEADLVTGFRDVAPADWTVTGPDVATIHHLLQARGSTPGGKA
ncbi:DEAD/DEAH box helicase [Kocuria tytonicola]|uniref:DEAD/DEAH box helicase n=1 Tax=Kocuria tytonicola TaxID=2055946 RepID=A0A3L9L4E9_9MICC|nr:DEAD/DEAH box helicase [Kocuria tytonicola]RLY93896.1 DEAD/DEAH box helicase [Kocuria tytonicola]